jgi:hypothetical protein
LSVEVWAAAPGSADLESGLRSGPRGALGVVTSGSFLRSRAAQLALSRADFLNYASKKWGGVVRRSVLHRFVDGSGNRMST